jgi:thioredoxin 1
MATTVTEQSFEEEVLQSDKPVIVDFWAEWCGPCHAVAPVLDRIVEESNGDLKLVKVNIDEQPVLSQRYGVQSIPTMILFKNGEPAASAIGAQPKPALEKALGLVDAAGEPSACTCSPCGMGETARPAGSFWPRQR